MALKFSIGDVPQGRALVPAPDSEVSRRLWMVAIPDLPNGEYVINKFSTANGDATIVIQKVGPPGDYCK